MASTVVQFDTFDDLRVLFDLGLGLGSGVRLRLGFG